MATLHLKPKDRIPDGFTDIVRKIGLEVGALYQSMPEDEFRALQLKIMEKVHRLLRAFPGGDQPDPGLPKSPNPSN